MALDFQRPDPSSPAAVASAQFTVTRRGYREEEVRDFLRQVSVELARLLERERFLENELKAVQSRAPLDVSAIDESTITELIGAEAARVLGAAKEAAQAMRDRAAESAEQIVREASREASRMLEESTLESSRRRSDVSSEAEQELELAKQQGREIVAEVRAYRERVLSDVAKRTEEARRELERLVYERERLLVAFERARHAATDVVGDLTEFDEAIRGAGIVPPLVPPDAPAPPMPTRTSSAPIFDAKQYLDELGSQPRNEPEASAAPTESSAMPTSEQSDSESTAAGDEHGAAPTPEQVSAPEPVPTPTNDASARHDAREQHDSSGRTERMAPVVSIFDRKRRSEPAASDDRELVEKAPEHPVFERVEAQPDVVAPPAPTSRVDEIFERLRLASTRRVASESKQDLETKDSVTIAASTRDPATKAVRPRPVDPSHFSRRDEVVASVLESMKRTTKRLAADDENSALTHVSTKKSALDVDAMLSTAEQHARRFVDAIHEEVTSIAVDAARSLSDSRRADVRKLVVDGAVSDAVAQFVISDFVRPIRERVTAAITSSDGDRDALTRSLRNEFAEWKTQRLESVVVDIAHLAYARGLFLGCDAKSHVCWAVDPNGPACADAEDNALAGRVRRGENFPTGHDQPLAHAGCRCLVVPLDK